MFPPVYYELARSKGHDLERRLGQTADRKRRLRTSTDGNASATDRSFGPDHRSDPIEALVLAEIKQFPTRVRACSESASTPGAIAATGARRADWQPRHRPA